MLQCVKKKRRFLVRTQLDDKHSGQIGRSWRCPLAAHHLRTASRNTLALSFVSCKTTRRARELVVCLLFTPPPLPVKTARANVDATSAA